MTQGPAPTPLPETVGYAPATTPQPGRGKAVASLVLGIFSLVAWFCPIIGLVVSILGLVLGIMARKEGQRGMATAGVITSSIGLGLCAINMAVGAYLGATGQIPWLKPPQQLTPATSAPGP